jgi:hypothetical protein
MRKPRGRGWVRMLLEKLKTAGRPPLGYQSATKRVPGYATLATFAATLRDQPRACKTT